MTEVIHESYKIFDPESKPTRSIRGLVFLLPLVLFTSGLLFYDGNLSPFLIANGAQAAAQLAEKILAASVG